MEDMVLAKSRVSDELLELSLLESDVDVDFDIALMSDSDDMKKLHYYIFSNVDGINLHVMDQPFDGDFSILSQMDIVLYNKADKVLEDDILEAILDKGMTTRFIHLVDESSFEGIDLVKEYLSGVKKVIKVNEYLGEYIIEMQKEIFDNFYTRRIQSLSVQETVYEKDEFENRVEELQDRRVYFSSLRFKYDADMDIESYDLNSIVRDKDTVYVDKENSEIYFLLIDVMPDSASRLIRDRIKNFSIRVSEVSSNSVFDIVFGD